MARKKTHKHNGRHNRVKVLRGAYRGSIGTLASLTPLSGRIVALVKFEEDGIHHRYELHEIERLVATH